MELRTNHDGRKKGQSHEGFTLLQAIIVMSVALIVGAATVLTIRAGRPGLHLANSAHQLAGYLERARADSVRRRAATGLESSIQILNNRTYRVTMGFGGSGDLTSRDFTLEGDVVFITDPTTISFDWRGRPLTGTETTLALQNSAGTTQVDITGSGDVTVGSENFQDQAIPNINLNQNVVGDVSPDPITPPESTPTPIPETDHEPTPTPSVVDDTEPTPTPTPTPKGNPNSTPTPTPTPTPTVTPTPTPNPSASPTPAGCAPSVTPTSLTVSKNGGSGTVTLVLGSIGGDVTTSAASNLTVSPSFATIAPGGSGAFTITSNNTTRGTFTVTFTTPCGTSSVAVTVVN